MFYVYILKNVLNCKHYIGSTNDLNRRTSEHNRHQTRSTAIKGNWKLIYKETFGTLSEARSREYKIKSYKGGNSFKRLVAGVVQQ